MSVETDKNWKFDPPYFEGILSYISQFIDKISTCNLAWNLESIEIYDNNKNACNPADSNILFKFIVDIKFINTQLIGLYFKSATHTKNSSIIWLIDPVPIKRRRRKK